MNVRPCHLLFASAAMILTPSVTHAHLVNSGLGPIYDGAVHMALSPDDVLGLVAAALLAGLRGPRAGRWTLAVLPTAWLLGGLVGLTFADVPPAPGLSILSFAALGLLVALDVKMKPWGVSAFAAMFGLLHGVLNGAALYEADKGVHTLLGIVATAFVVTLLVSGTVVSLRPAWTRVAVRVVGSWVVAVGMLMFGWLFQGAM